GVGRIMLARLIELGRQLGFHKLVLACFPTNKAGVPLYERMSFTQVGIYREKGLLDGKWVDVLIMEQILADRWKRPICFSPALVSPRLSRRSTRNSAPPAAPSTCT